MRFGKYHAEGDSGVVVGRPEAAAAPGAWREPDRPARTVVRQPGATITVTWERARPQALTLEGSAHPIAAGEVRPW
jgi:hypothetical protein